jgi:hypothetical protein
MTSVVRLSALGLAMFAALAAVPAAARAQTGPAPFSLGNLPQQSTPPPPSSDGPADLESNVGYIDGAIPMNQFRLRFDAAYDNNRPSRAEFFYAKPRLLGGKGPLFPDNSVDYQELTGYLEMLAVPGVASVFIEAPFRWVNPNFNPSEYGFGDVTGGFKWALWQEKDFIATFQLRGTVPTRAGPALGTNHYSLEPGLLFNQRLLDIVTVEGELRYWIPLGGSDFAGDVIRYGIGVSYGDHSEEYWLAPVAELVGWTVLGGKETVAFTPTDFGVINSAGETIVNAKLGLRAGLPGQIGDWYVGYGRCLTGDRWYRDVWRVEMRLRF